MLHHFKVTPYAGIIQIRLRVDVYLHPLSQLAPRFLIRSHCSMIYFIEQTKAYIIISLLLENIQLFHHELITTE